MRKELPNQESLFDSIPASDRLYGVGDRLYRLVLDSVRPIVVTEAFECRDCDDPLGGRTFWYHSNQEGGGNWTFGKGDVGVNVFESRADAEAQGVRNIREMGVDVVPAASIAPSEWLALEENGASFGRARPLYACCGLVGGTFVFRKGWHAYCFLDAYPDEKAARRAYGKALAEVRGFRGMSVSEAGFRSEDMYGRGDGRWASAEYAYNNWFGGLGL